MAFPITPTVTFYTGDHTTCPTINPHVNQP